MSDIKPNLALCAAGAAFCLLIAAPCLAADAPSAPAATSKAKAANAIGADTKAAAPAAQVKLPPMTAAQVLDKHIAARGGAQAWKSVQALRLSGKIDAGKGDNNARAMQMVKASKKASGKGTAREIAAADGPRDSDRQVELPFSLDLKRPNKTRLEIVFAGKTAVQVYDGQNGWKLRPYLDRDDVEAFTPDEARTEAARDDLDGPLIGAAAKGARLELVGAELVEGQPAYKLKVTQKSGSSRDVWIDAKTFLDVKMDGFPRRMDGKERKVYVYQRDFRSVQGVMIPFVLETAVDGYSDTHKMTVEKAVVNPPLDESLFTKPHA